MAITTKNLSVSHLIRKFNILMNTRNYQIFPNSCNCIYRMCNSENCEEGGLLMSNIQIECPVHTNAKNKFISMFTQKFVQRNILYFSTQYYEKILYNKQLHLMLPLIINLHTNRYGICHFFDRKIPSKLNNVCVNFTNLLIVNFIICEKKHCNNYNDLLIKYKTMTFKYAIFINCIKKPNNYIHKITNKFRFIFKLSDFVNNIQSI